MGRGVDYRGSYPHLMLYDGGYFQLQCGNYEVTGVFPGAVVPGLLENVAKAAGIQADELTIDPRDPSILRFETPEHDVAQKVEQAFRRRYFQVETEEPGVEFDEESFREFLREFGDRFRCESFYPEKPHYISNEAYLVGETEYLEIGVDHSGDVPCIFARPKFYKDDDEEIPYQIDNTVREAFNTMIENHGPKFFSFPSGSYTSFPLTKYER